MLLENTHAGELIDELSKLILNVTKTILKDVVLPGGFKSVLEDDKISSERVLVHLRDG